MICNKFSYQTRGCDIRGNPPVFPQPPTTQANAFNHWRPSNHARYTRCETEQHLTLYIYIYFLTNLTILPTVVSGITVWHHCASPLATYIRTQHGNNLDLNSVPTIRQKRDPDALTGKCLNRRSIMIPKQSMALSSILTMVGCGVITSLTNVLFGSILGARARLGYTKPAHDSKIQ